MATRSKDDESIPTADGPVTVANGVVTVPDSLRVRRPPKSAPLEHVRRRSSAEGAPVLEHASWCCPTGGREEIRTETFRIRNDTTGQLFETTRCQECAAQVTINLSTGAIKAEAGDNSFVPRFARADPLEFEVDD